MTDHAPTKPTYTITAERTNCFTRWPCGICEGWTDKEDIDYTYRDAEGDEHFVCHQCMADGVDTFPEKLRTHAEGLRAWADDLDRDAGQGWQADTDAIKELQRQQAEYWDRRWAEDADTHGIDPDIIRAWG